MPLSREVLDLLLGSIAENIILLQTKREIMHATQRQAGVV